MKADRQHRYAASILALCLLLITGLALTGCSFSFNIGGGGDKPDPAKYGEETFSGTTWTAGDGSELVFGDDGILHWYRTEGVHDGDRFEGPYVAHRGQAAYDFLVDDLTEYGVTAEELDRLIGTGDPDRELDDLVVYTLDHQTVIMDGEPYTFDDPVVPYYGFLNDDATKMDVVNMRTATTYLFTKK
ncbi:MAG: hypothetical protein K6B12_04835 [Clostridiales bacterium]|nr:hypothetical protein [Clostridiales bacterium]